MLFTFLFLKQCGQPQFRDAKYEGWPWVDVGKGRGLLGQANGLDP